MPLWGIVLVIAAAWVVVSLVLAVIIGRAVRIADIAKADADFVYSLSDKQARRRNAALAGSRAA